MGTMMHKAAWGGVAAAALIAATPALADKGFYGKAMLGVGSPSDLDVNVEDQITGVSSEFDIEAEAELRVLLGAGYRFGNGWRADGDFVLRENDLGSVDEIQGSSEFEGAALMANLAYEFNRDGTLVPYLGGGAGVGFADITVTDAGQTGSSDEYRTSGQVFAGLGFDVSKRVSATVEYRYFRMINDIDVVVGGEEFRFRDPDSHDLFVGLSINFGSVAAPAAAAAVAAPPAIVGGPVPTICDDLPFVVYFGWDSAQLVPQQLQVIKQAAIQARECDITRVTVVGHADTSGDERYNFGLSERRAAMVRNALIQEGVEARLITVEGKGETEPAKDTGDDVREELNRRAESMILVIKDD